MFHVKIDIKPSRLHGLGLFAGENIKKGQKIYTPNPELDLFLPEKKFSELSADEKATVRHYGFFDKKADKWHLSFDNIRFCNHNKEGNMTLAGKILIAKQNIRKGEEITQDYGEFENLREGV